MRTLLEIERSGNILAGLKSLLSGRIFARKLCPGVVRAAHQRSGLDVREAEVERGVAESCELGGRHVPLDRQMTRVGARPKVLTEGQDVAPDGAQISENTEKLGLGLAEAEHQAGLRREPGTTAGTDP